ncbi:MAG: 4Fe-4S binding protein [Lachnospiraceae bacterium]|nr:4Fe-4S binding protein [Lachnospiraceae bacterium]MDD3617454.1 4Fe-4S binding protein [Lachnospiraceae bacterium]
MDAKTCLKKLGYVGTLAFATVDEFGNPQVRNVSAIHYEEDSLYFYTAQGKNFCKELKATKKVQILGLTMYKEMIRLSGDVIYLEGEESVKWRDLIFKEQPYLENAYPGDTKDIGAVFLIKDAEIEYFNLSVYPIFRESYVIGNGQITPKGFEITDSCINCGTCEQGCPQKAVVPGTPYRIRPENCLHCGRCEVNCPVQAIKRL